MITTLASALTLHNLAELFVTTADPTPWCSTCMFFDAANAADEAEAEAKRFDDETQRKARNSICQVIDALKKNGTWKGGAIPPHCNCGH